MQISYAIPVCNEHVELEKLLSFLHEHIDENDEILIVDDLIATGGTAIAAAKLIRRLKGNVAACCFIVGLPDLGGVSKLKKNGVDVVTLCNFDGH